MRVMIVDDDPEIVALFEEALTRGGHAPTSFSNGGLALGAIVRGKFELLLLDLDLPNLGGIDLIRIVRDQFPYLPIIVISGLEESEWQPKALNAGASLFFSKPVRLNELLDEVELVRKSRVNLNIGIIDGDGDHQRFTSSALQSLGCDVRAWPSFVDMLQDDEGQRDISVLLVESTANEFGDAMIWAKGREIAAVAFSDDTPDLDQEPLLRAGAAFCLTRPVDAEALIIQARFFVAPAPLAQASG